jgi:hypothetical protein
MTDRRAPSIPVVVGARLPSWLRSRPFLLASALRGWNIHQQHKLLLPGCVVLLLVVGVLLTQPVVGHALEAVAHYPLAPFASLAAACAISSARRMSRIHASLVDSWLAPLAARASVLSRALLGPLLQLTFLAAAIAIPLLTGSLSRGAATVLWLIVGAALLVGSVLGWLLVSRHKGHAAAPAFHYVEIRKPRADWARAPSLLPLSYWAVGEAKVFSKPKVVARAMLVVLMSMPMGVPGQQALAIATGAWILIYVGSLILAMLLVAFAAARWLAPTTLGYLRFTVGVGYRAVLAQLWTWSWVLFLIYAAGVHAALRIGLPLAVGCLLLSGVAVAVAARVSMTSVGMRLP